MVFALDRRDIADQGEEPPVVAPVDLFEGGQLYRFDVVPRAMTVDVCGATLTREDRGAEVGAMVTREQVGNRVRAGSAYVGRGLERRRRSEGVCVAGVDGRSGSRPV